MSKTMRRALLWLPAGLVIIGCATGVQLAKKQIDHPGQLLFNGYTDPAVDCYSCHNGDGSGTGRGPDLAQVVPPMSDEAVLDTIRDGADWMPGFDEQLSDEQELQILDWLRTEFGGPPVAEEVEVEAVD